MKHQTKELNEIIIKPDTYSDKVLDTLQENLDQINEFLQDFQAKYHINFTDDNLKILPQCSNIEALSIASRFYGEFTPSFAEAQRKELADRLIDRPKGEKSLQNLLNFMQRSVHFTKPDTLTKDYTSVKNGKYVICTDAKERLKELFEEKISGANFEAFRKAQSIVKEVNELREMFGVSFGAMFNHTLSGESIEADERAFIDA